MINSNGLRIGNWVLELGWDEDAGGNIVGDTGSNEFVQVDIALLSEIAKPTPGEITKYDGIPLTPEILEKAGFLKSKAHHLDYFKSTSIGNNSFGFRIGRPFKHENQWWPEIKYLHQLQNLYFALTGEELEVNFISSMSKS